MAEIVEHITDARSDGTINVYAVRYNQRGRSDNVAIALPGNPSFDFRHDFCENIICYKDAHERAFNPTSNGLEDDTYEYVPLENVREKWNEIMNLIDMALDYHGAENRRKVAYSNLYIGALVYNNQTYYLCAKQGNSSDRLLQGKCVLMNHQDELVKANPEEVFLMSSYVGFIMDYSIHDAIEAGFNHVVFIIRKDIEKEFKEVIGDRIAKICEKHNVTVDYAFQDINDIPGELPEGRTKPWGTGQAVLAAKNVIDTPFIVINADDYYGKEGFKAVHEYLVNGGKSCMAGFVLKNTLSDNGGVTRGICKMDEDNNLTEVVETKNIVKTATGAEADGVIINTESLVSMNMWGLTPDFLDVLEEGFKEFFEKEVPDNPLKAEYLIPIFIGELLEQGKMSVKVLKTNDTWYGMTYHEDVAAVKDSFKKMLENGVYKADLFSDL